MDKGAKRMAGAARKALIFLLWLLLWFCLALAVNNKILLSTPRETARELGEMLGRASVYAAVGRSLSRIFLGFVSGVLTAALLAAVCSRFPFARELLTPMIHLIKTVPVACFAVLLLIWWGASFLSAAICFLVVLPNVYIGVLEGISAADKRLLQMAEVFGMSRWNRFFYIYCPAIRPFFIGSLKVSLGMCWKSGVAAELIATPDGSVGEQLYLSKLYLNTAGVFAWTAVIVALSAVFEKLALWLAERFFAWQPPCRRPLPLKGPGRRAERASGAGEGEEISVRLEGVSKGFGGRPVLEDFRQEYRKGETYYLTWPSGGGKTTLLSLIAGILEPDGGVLLAPGRVGVLFQEDRLCEECDAVKNVELVTGDRQQARRALLRLLPEEALDRPCAQLSGGMRRRVALARAMEAHSGAVLLDEPYAGLDAGTRELAESYIRERKGDRTLIIATHI